MNATRVGGVLLIIAGTLGLVLGGLVYGRDTQRTTIGSVEVSVSEDRVVNIPIWVGAGAIGLGFALLLVGRKGHV